MARNDQNKIAITISVGTRWKHNTHGNIYVIDSVHTRGDESEVVLHDEADPKVGLVKSLSDLQSFCTCLDAVKDVAFDAFQARFLGKSVKASDGTLDLIPLQECHAPLDVVNIECSEFTSFCPVTGMPDFARVVIEYVPNKHLIETKSLKLYLQTFRDVADFNESLACRLCNEIYNQLKPKALVIECQFNARGGIAVNAKASIGDLREVSQPVE